jgi:hypothetical protein
MRSIRFDSCGAMDSATSAPMEWATRQKGSRVSGSTMDSRNPTGRFKVAETAHMPAQRVFHQTVGKSLAPPVKGRDPETAAGEMADGFIVFFDALIASLQQNDRAARDRHVGLEDGIAQPLAAGSFEPAGDVIAGHRVAFGLNQQGSIVTHHAFD